MKKINYITLIFAALLLTVSFSPIAAQDETPIDEPQQRNLNQPRRPNLLAELDLSTEQIRQIRRINREQRPLLRQAQQRMREANRSLDQAIYADAADEAEIQLRLKDAQAAQAEVVKLRSTIEYHVRKVLTPEQLVRFREVRQRFMERLENLQKIQKERPLNAPAQRLVNRHRKARRND